MTQSIADVLQPAELSKSSRQNLVDSETSKATTLGKPLYLMATQAIHYLRDLSRSISDLCLVQRETDKYYVGNWIEGFGFFDILFPKDTTQALTDKEIIKFKRMYEQFNFEFCSP